MLTQFNYSWIGTGKWHVKLFLFLTFLKIYSLSQHRTRGKIWTKPFQPFWDGLTINQVFCSGSHYVWKSAWSSANPCSCNSIWPLLGINKALNKLICIVWYKPEIFKRACYLNSTAESQFIICLKKQNPHCREMCFVSGFHKKGFFLL